MRGIKEFLQEEDGVAVVEMILILVIITGIVVVFKDKITGITTKVFNQINKDANSIL